METIAALATADAPMQQRLLAGGALLEHASSSHVRPVAALLLEAVSTQSGREIAEFVPNEE